MPQVFTEIVTPQTIAAVRVRTDLGGIAQAWKPALDQVWDFLHRNPGLRTDGHNLFLYHHPARRTDPMDIDFGVEVVRAFSAADGVSCVETPAGEVAVAVHRGLYANLSETHDAIHAWCAANGRGIGGFSWELYGDWSDDPAKLETTVRYLLR